MAGKKISTKVKAPETAKRESTLAHRLDTLLHTMRCIAQHEDALCELSHGLKRSGVLTVETREELRSILEEVPSMEYVHDLDSVGELLTGPIARKAPAARKGKGSVASPNPERKVKVSSKSNAKGSGQLAP